MFLWRGVPWVRSAKGTSMRRTVICPSSGTPCEPFAVAVVQRTDFWCDPIEMSERFGPVKAGSGKERRKPVPTWAPLIVT